MYFLSLFVVASSSIMLSIKVFGYPLSQFYPFGQTAGDSSLPANDDDSTSRIPISVPFPFFGPSYSFIYVNNNGDVTFDSSLTQYTAQEFPINGSHKMIAPFWTDISTFQGGFLWYRSTTDFSTLQLGTNIIRTAFPSFVTFSANWMMVVTWEGVAAYGCSGICQQRNTFQLVLITNGVHSFVEFNYNKITWTKFTQVGFNAGDGTHYYSVSGSMTDSMLNLPHMSNIGVPGQFVFRVDAGANPEIDECQSSPCIHGSCLDHLNHYTCHCEPGYTGYNCQTDIDECSSSPCVNGNCSDRVNGYECNCLPGYTGRLCEIDIDECQSSPCINGDCTNNINFYTCQCFAGFTGTNCEIDIDECEISPCVHGNCTDQVNGYVCECIPGYIGVICETVDVLYLWPMLVGLLLLLLSVFLLFLWKRWKRHYSGEEESGLLAFNDVTQGPGKAAFQSSPHVNKTKISIPVKECVGFFSEDKPFVNLIKLCKNGRKSKNVSQQSFREIDIVKD